MRGHNPLGVGVEAPQKKKKNNEGVKLHNGIKGTVKGANCIANLISFGCWRRNLTRIVNKLFVFIIIYFNISRFLQI